MVARSPTHAKNKRNKKWGNGKPKYLIILRKSPPMKRWLLRNPWIRPMCVFNYAAIKIQKLGRGYLTRKYGRQNKFKAIPKQIAAKKKITKTNQQLDKYLSYLDNYKRLTCAKPNWLDGGYSAWCAVKIQSIARMRRTRRRYFLSKRLVAQVACIIIQTAWRNCMYTEQLEPEIVPRRVLTPHQAARRIQFKWREYCNKRIYRYFAELIKNKLKGAPNDLLRSIIPNEADILDRASGVHVRFRLGGLIFPPKVYFKIYTHRPLCDVNSFAPRDYRSEKKTDEMMLHNKSSKTVDFKGAGARTNKLDTIKVGAKYFNTVVMTNSQNGTADWYKRDEKNNWRAISSHLFESVLTPPWFLDQGHTSKPKSFHFSSLTRVNELKALRKRKKRAWKLKAYMLASSGGGDQTPVVAVGERNIDQEEEEERDNFVENVPLYSTKHITSFVANQLGHNNINNNNNSNNNNDNGVGKDGVMFGNIIQHNNATNNNNNHNNTTAAGNYLNGHYGGAMNYGSAHIKKPQFDLEGNMLFDDSEANSRASSSYYNNNHNANNNANNRQFSGGGGAQYSVQYNTQNNIQNNIQNQGNNNNVTQSFALKLQAITQNNIQNNNNQFNIDMSESKFESKFGQQSELKFGQSESKFGAMSDSNILLSQDITNQHQLVPITSAQVTRNVLPPLNNGNNNKGSKPSKHQTLTNNNKNKNHTQNQNHQLSDNNHDQYGGDLEANLVDWSLALDFDRYSDAWNSLGTSMPSDIDNSVMYHLAGTQNKELSMQFYGKK